MSFAADVRKFAEKTGTRLDQACRAIKISLFTGVIMDTRVDTGRLRGNWQTSTGTPKYSTVDRLDKFEKGQPGGTAYNEAIAWVKAFTVDYMTNNLPYAEVMEKKDGMVEKNIVKTMNEVRMGAYGHA